MPVLFVAGIALAFGFAYTAKLLANAIDYQVSQNIRYSPKGGYYERHDLPEAPR